MMKSLRYQMLVLLVLLILVSFFQNCSRLAFSPVDFFSSQAASGGSSSGTSGGNGDFYDGKPGPGVYDRILPDRACGGESSPLGRVTITQDVIRLEKADPQSCARGEIELIPSLLEFSKYNPGYIGFEEGVYRKQDAAAVGAILPEAWCRKSGSDVNSGIDAVIETDPATGLIRSRLFADASIGISSGTEIPTLAVKRTVAEHQVRYEGKDFLLAVEVASGHAKSSAQLQATVQGKVLNEKMDCRLAGELDPVLIDAPPPNTFRVEGATSSTDLIADGHLIGTQSAAMNWSSLVAASAFDLMIYGSDGTSLVCAPPRAPADSTSAALDSCSLQDGVAYQVRLQALTVFGGALPAVNLPFRFALARPVPLNGTSEPQLIPGKVEVENYDLGGEGIAYHDTTPGDLGGASLRGDDVDVIPIQGGLGVARTETGEWLKFTVEVATTGDYDATIGIDSSAAGAVASLRLEIDGVDATGALQFAKTTVPGGYPHFSLGTLHLTKGVHQLRLVIEGRAFNMSHMIFNLKP